MEGEMEQLSLEQFKTIIKTLDASMDDYLYIYDLQNDRYCISQNAVSKFMFPSMEFNKVNENLANVVWADDMDMLTEELDMVIRGEKAFHDCQYRWVDRENRPVWINCRGTVIRNDQGEAQFLVGCVNEIGNKQKADNVSGLLGEASLKKQIVEHDGRLKGFVLRIGIDGFKEINENHGMDYGDMVLRRTAECIDEAISGEEMLYRIVADEFIVLNLSGGSQEKAIELYSAVKEQVKRFIAENGYEVFFTISAGILDLHDVVNHTYFNIMKLSEFALNEAKNQGRNKYYIYCRGDYHVFKDKKNLIRIMRNAVNQGFRGFQTVLQPVVDTKSRKIIGAEVLLRFSSEETGVVSPGRFVPLLEESGLIIPVGRFVIYQALEACKKAQKTHPGFRISLNVSYVQVLRSDVLSDLVAALRQNGLSADSVQVELTESGFLEADNNFIRFCEGLKEYGILLALDDFGTGYSNFHYLNYLTPETIKIDRSFTLKALQNASEYNLLQHMTDMCHSIPSKFCIEGIETKDELEKISRMGPDYIQGYYFGKPCPYGEFEELYLTIPA